MKRNLIIIFLFIAIIFVTVNIFSSNVVTKRKIAPYKSNQIAVSQDVSLDTDNINTTEPETKNSNDEMSVELSAQNFEIPSQKPVAEPYSAEISNLTPDFQKQENSRQNYEQPKKYYSESQNITANQEQQKPKNFEDSLKMCFPYQESLTTDFMGLVKVKYTISILGWENSKCILDFDSEVLGMGADFDSLLGEASVSGQVVGNIPKVHCEFTKKQILDVGENLLQEHSRQSGMLKNPEEINIPTKLDISDLKMLKIIFADKACKILNADDYFQMMF